MISVVMPTLNAQKTLTGTLAALVPGVLEGLVRELVIVDGGSGDDTLKIADEAGAVVVETQAGRGAQLKAGGEKARGPWLLFLHADTRLAPGWVDEARAFIERDSEGGHERAAAFRFALDDVGMGDDERMRARWLEKMVYLRCFLFGLPYGDQGLLISKRHYERLGGFLPMPLMEDVDLVRRIGGVTMLSTRALTSAERFRQQGYARRIWRNLSCLALYYLGVSPEKIRARYEKQI